MVPGKEGRSAMDGRGDPTYMTDQDRRHFMYNRGSSFVMWDQIGGLFIRTKCRSC